jgi:hypothetical protein
VYADKALLLLYLSDQSRQRELDLEEAHQARAQHGGRGDDDDDLHQVPEEEQEEVAEGGHPWLSDLQIPTPCFTCNAKSPSSSAAHPLLLLPLTAQACAGILG